jgi:hypothetical protein
LAGIPGQPVVYDLFFRLHVTEINQLVLKHAQPFLGTPCSRHASLSGT